jgi:hypothetical protein
MIRKRAWQEGINPVQIKAARGVGGRRFSLQYPAGAMWRWAGAHATPSWGACTAPWHSKQVRGVHSRCGITHE